MAMLCSAAKVFSGAGEGYFVAFALELGIDPLKAGLLGTLPLFFGGTFQLFFPKILEKLSNYNRFIYLASAIQATSFFPLVAFAFFQFKSGNRFFAGSVPGDYSMNPIRDLENGFPLSGNAYQEHPGAKIDV